MNVDSVDLSKWKLNQIKEHDLLSMVSQIESYSKFQDETTCSSIGSSRTSNAFHQLHSTELKMDEEYDVIWIKDEEVDKCMVCRDLFSIMKRRHHCRSCGCVVCSRCSPTRLPVYGLVGLQRVCSECLSNGVWIDPKEKAQGMKQMKPPPVDEQARERLREFYQQHAPAKVDRVDELLRKYAADLDGMLEALERKYITVEPVVFKAAPVIVERPKREEPPRVQPACCAGGCRIQ